MPAPEFLHNYRNSSSKSEASSPGPSNTVAEPGTGRHGRKRGKNALRKETDLAKDANPIVANELEGSQVSYTVEGVDGRATTPPPATNDNVTSIVMNSPNSAGKVTDHDGPTYVGACAQSTPFSNSHPSDLLEGMTGGVSPPAAGSVTERSGLSTTPPSSPPLRKTRLANSGSGIPPAQAHRRQSSTGKSLRMPHQPFDASSPPPPHLPQAHFYGVPDIDLGIGVRPGDVRSDGQVRFLSFAELPSVNATRRKNHLDVVLLALEDRLDILKLEKDNLAALGALEGVGGTILDAKILTWDFGHDPFHVIRPLVALVVHGPRRWDLPQQPASVLASNHEPEGISSPDAVQFSGRTKESTDFQTVVEIYSLSTQERVATLLWSQPCHGLPSIRGLPVTVPAPVGNLKLDARGNFLTVSSGTSGEIFAFGAETDTPKFRCLGKFWTSVQNLHDRRYSNSSNSTDTDASPADMNRAGKPAPLPIMSLSGRWLALVPPGPLACLSLPVTVDPTSIAMAVHGLDSRNAPPPPPVSCALESPDAESFMDRVARGVAQEVVRGARWLGGQGLQTWNNYWNRDQHQHAQTSAPSHHICQADSPLTAGIFPPTHAPESRPASSEPQLVSIFDLQILSRRSCATSSDAVTPFATFQPPNGVSFLSFSPDGLAIFSATRTGDIQYVWDLRQSKLLPTGILLANQDSETWSRSAKVTQLARFARLTPSSIVDVEWKGPLGDRFAVITKNGTIHIFDLPLSAFGWPSSRRSVRAVPSSAPPSPAVNAQPDEATVAGGVFSSAMKLAGKTQPVLATLRGRAPSIGMSNALVNGHNTIGFASATSIRGSKAVAAGLSKSVEAATGTVSSLRHAGDNRLHLNSLARFPTRARVCWSQHQRQSALAVVDGQCIKLFHVSRRRASPKPGRQPLSVIETNPSLNVALPAPDQLLALSVNPTPVLHRHGAAQEGHATGYWAFWPSMTSARSSPIVHPLSCAEIETNAPYQPFHSDGRVSLFVFTDRLAEVSATSMHEPLVFGGEIATTRLEIHAPSVVDEEEQHSGGSTLYRHTYLTSGEAIGSDKRMTEQMVVTTKRRKNKSPYQLGPAGTKPEEDNGFFEDDCDVLGFADGRR